MLIHNHVWLVTIKVGNTVLHFHYTWQLIILSNHSLVILTSLYINTIITTDLSLLLNGFIVLQCMYTNYFNFSM